MALRIKGLVRAHNAIRAQLRAGVAPSKVASLQRSIQALTHQVESLCLQHGTTPERLPSPSRNAYHFLKNLDVTNLPDDLTALPLAPKIHVRNVVKTRQELAETLWINREAWLAEPDQTTTFQRSLRTHLDALEDACRRQEATPEALAGYARRLYVWLQYLSQGNHLTAYLAALTIAWDALTALSPLDEEHVRIYLFNNRSLWRRRNEVGQLTLQVNLGFLHADRKVWRAIMRSALHQNPRPNRLIVQAFAHSEAFRTVQHDLDDVLSSSRPQGCVHNLEASFARVNERYFAGTLPQPILRWNNRMTCRTFGTYQPSTDTVTLSITLDQPEVPAFVVDFVMYHELLHKKHGMQQTDRTRRVHTSAFRQDETAFAEYEAAQAILRSLTQS